MTRVLLDIDVVLDVLANRGPFADEAEAVLQRVESRAITGRTLRTDRRSPKR